MVLIILTIVLVFVIRCFVFSRYYTNEEMKAELRRHRNQQYWDKFIAEDEE